MINSLAETDETSSQTDKTTTSLSQIEGRKVHFCGESKSFGGMLRVLFCSLDLVRNVLVRETAVRVQSGIVEMVLRKWWLKVCLQNPTTVTTFGGCRDPVGLHQG